MLPYRTRCLLLALPLVGAFVALYVLSNQTAAGESWENWLLRAHHYDGTLGPLLGREIPFPPFDADLPTLIVGTLVAAVLAAAGRRWRTLLVVLTAPPITLIATAVFKHLFGRPNLTGARLDTDVSYPSGHAAIALAVTAALIMAVPRAWLRWVVPILVGWSGMASAALQSVGYHRPSEVLGTGLLTPALFLLLCAVVGAAPSTADRELPRASVAASGFILAVVAIAAGWNDIPWAVGLYAVVAAISVLLTAHTALALRSPRTRQGGHGSPATRSKARRSELVRN